jgi:NAD(P)-dependent dehydrogenase (short-subunit alcohol dehydrogenase family)
MIRQSRPWSTCLLLPILLQQPQQHTTKNDNFIIKFIKADLSNVEETEAIIPKSIIALQKAGIDKPIISGVVNAAATTARGNLATTTASSFNEQYNTNVRAPFLITKHASQHMMEMNLERGMGSIVNICSVASKGGAPFILGYSCAKSAALKTLTKNNAAELASQGIRVNGIDMGWCLTENEDRLQSALGGEDWWEKADESVPLGRILRPVDVAASVLFLLSGASVMMTGSIIGEL